MVAKAPSEPLPLKNGAAESLATGPTNDEATERPSSRVAVDAALGEQSRFSPAVAEPPVHVGVLSFSKPRKKMPPELGNRTWKERV